MVEVNIEEGFVQAQEYVEHVDNLRLLKLPPFSSLHQVLLSIRMCNFKTLSSGGAKLGVDSIHAEHPFALRVVVIGDQLTYLEAHPFTVTWPFSRRMSRPLDATVL